MAQSAPTYFTSPSLEAAGKAAAQGQAAYNEQDEFNDPQGKYKLVMKGAIATDCPSALNSSFLCSADQPQSFGRSCDFDFFCRDFEHMKQVALIQCIATVHELAGPNPAPSDRSWCWGRAPA